MFEFFLLLVLLMVGCLGESVPHAVDEVPLRVFMLFEAKNRSRSFVVAR